MTTPTWAERCLDAMSRRMVDEQMLDGATECCHTRRALHELWLQDADPPPSLDATALQHASERQR